jgi:hypothetical protein
MTPSPRCLAWPCVLLKEVVRRCSAASLSRRPDTLVCCSTDLAWAVPSPPSRPLVWSGELFFHLLCVVFSPFVQNTICRKGARVQ